MFESAGTVVCLLENGCVAQFGLDESGELPTAEVAAAAGVAAAAPTPIPVTSR